MLLRVLLTTVGSLALAAGVIGVFVPVWPTTPFLLLSAACYVRGSPRLYRWLLEHRRLGCYVRDFVSGRGIPLRAKWISLSLMWVTTTMSSVGLLLRFGVHAWTIAYGVGLLGVAIWVHRYISYRIPTRSPDDPSSACDADLAEG